MLIIPYNECIIKNNIYNVILRGFKMNKKELVEFLNKFPDDIEINYWNDMEYVIETISHISEVFNDDKELVGLLINGQ